MDFADIKTKNTAELKSLLAEKADELRDMRFKLQSQQLKTVNKISEAKKMVARISMILTAKAREATKK
jgi:ribosomal protein L29